MTRWSRCLVVMAVAASGCAHPQPTRSWDEAHRRLKDGAPVAVTTVDGIETSGAVESASASGLTLRVASLSRHFDSKDIRQLRRDGDPLWNGLLIGAGIGAVGAILPDARDTCCPPGRDQQIPQRIAFFAIATTAGVVIDALYHDRSVVYDVPSPVTLNVAPILSPHTKGVLLSVGF